jgi:hypothetical protein
MATLFFGSTVCGVTIVSPRQLAEKMRARGWLGPD